MSPLSELIPGEPWGQAALGQPWGQPWGQTDLEFSPEEILNRSDPKEKQEELNLGDSYSEPTSAVAHIV